MVIDDVSRVMQMVQDRDQVVCLCLSLSWQVTIADVCPLFHAPAVLYPKGRCMLLLSRGCQASSAIRYDVVVWVRVSECSCVVAELGQPAIKFVFSLLL